MADLWGRFDYDVSSNGFPAELRSTYEFEAHGRLADPGFTDPASGNFALVDGAAAAASGCEVRSDASGALTCVEVDAKSSFAGAMAPDGSLYRGPGGPQFQPPG